MANGYLKVNGKDVEVDFGLLKEVEGNTVTFFTDKEIEIKASDEELGEIGEIYGYDDENLFAIDRKNKKVILDFELKELEEETLVAAKDNFINDRIF